jgi:excisionase family DNA binding protein
MSNGDARSHRLDDSGQVERRSARPNGCPPERDPSCQKSGARRGALGGSNRLLTVAQVAEYLGIPEKTLYQRWRPWGLTAYKVGRHLRFRERDIESWLERQEVPGA